MRTYLTLFCLLWLLTACSDETAGPREVQASMQQATMTEATAPVKVDPDSTTLARFKQAMGHAKAARWHTLPMGEIMQAVALQFLGTPYEGGTLDVPEEETLLAQLRSFDCVLLVETALAMARGIAHQDYTFETFAGNLQALRYRDGQLEGYCSRLHYFSEWIVDNEARGHVRNITQELGGERLDKTLTFMGEHRSSYPRLVANDSLYQGIIEMEERLAGLELYYIPQERIREAYGRLKAGDIIATATNIAGLDVSHSGLVYNVGDGQVGFLHASTSGGVKVSPDLQAYVENNKIQIGIVVARPVDDR